jgi:hypothetical protein
MKDRFWPASIALLVTIFVVALSAVAWALMERQGNLTRHTSEVNNGDKLREYRNSIDHWEVSYPTEFVVKSLDTVKGPTGVIAFRSPDGWAIAVGKHSVQEPLEQVVASEVTGPGEAPGSAVVRRDDKDGYQMVELAPVGVERQGLTTFIASPTGVVYVLYSGFGAEPYTDDQESIYDSMVGSFREF